ncbi:contractile injection system protein, VgrG/Pvc8 family, partial [Sungkyunkwania multivorans]
MALQSTIEIYIGGDQLKAFKEFRLEQRIDAHHHLEVVCRTDVLEDASGELSTETKNFLGEVLTLKVGSLDGISLYKELEFKGVVTSITSTRGFQYQHGDVVVITAMSASVLTDDGPHHASFSDTPLSGIVERTFQDYDKSKVELSVSPGNTDALHYSVQSGESAFGYASRLA